MLISIQILHAPITEELKMCGKIKVVVWRRKQNCFVSLINLRLQETISPASFKIFIMNLTVVPETAAKHCCLEDFELEIMLYTRVFFSNSNSLGQPRKVYKAVANYTS